MLTHTALRTDRKVFSQWGDDGIIQHLVNSIEIEHETFIEFGVETFFESNCRFLMMNDNWRGFVMDGSADCINFLEQSNFYWRYDLNAVSAFGGDQRIEVIRGLPVINVITGADEAL